MDNTNAPAIELRNIKHAAFASEETHCYSATLYVDGVKWGVVSNDGHGGADNFYGVNGKSWRDIVALDERIKATVPPYVFEGVSLEQDLEMLCADIVNQWLARRDFERAMKSKLLFVKPDAPGIWHFKIAAKDAPAKLPALRAKFPEYRFLADMPRADAMALYLGQ